MDSLVTFISTVPSLSVEVVPPTSVILDTAPYNSIQLRCNAIVSSNVAVSKNLQWMRSSIPIASTNGDVVINTEGLADRVTTSVLTAHGGIPASYIYSCFVRLDIPGGSTIEKSADANVTINGRSGL